MGGEFAATRRTMCRFWPSDASEHVVRIRSNVHGDPDAKIERIVGAEIVRPSPESPIAASRLSDRTLPCPIQIVGEP
jgi:hypothetical protein